MHPNDPQQVRTDPNGSEQVRKLQKRCKYVRNIAEAAKISQSNIQFFYSLIKNQNIEILEMFSIKDGEAIDQYVLKQEMPE